MSSLDARRISALLLLRAAHTPRAAFHFREREADTDTLPLSPCLETNHTMQLHQAKKLDGEMDTEPSAAAALNVNGANSSKKTLLNNAQTTDEVSWSKIGIRAGGVNAKKSARYTTRSRGKGRGPRRVVEVGSAAQSHGETGKANNNSSSSKSSKQPSKTSFLFATNPKHKRRRTNIFTRHG